MKLTKKQAIDRTIILWTWLAETGKGKEDWPEWEKYGETDNDCFLCKYAYPKDTNCEACPYCEMFGDCLEDDAPFENWCNARTPETRKKYAKEFLGQMYQLQKPKFRANV